MHTETYSLQFPYTTSAGQRVESISLKRLKVKDIKAVKKISDDPSNWDDGAAVTHDRSGAGRHR
ncbi:hypothetical protein PCC21_015920 [Pectobacterium carotovorum subsp. carotovorum PCC21]|nr:hypothetical protein PCC21_015920 [Pectobacterium carotovorum subsp. carotovorum PCC21]